MRVKATPSNSMLRISTASESPGSAPRTRIGPFAGLTRFGSRRPQVRHPRRADLLLAASMMCGAHLAAGFDLGRRGHPGVECIDDGIAAQLGRHLSILLSSQ